MNYTIIGCFGKSERAGYKNEDEVFYRYEIFALIFGLIKKWHQATAGRLRTAKVKT